jgi:hypothetical protein
MDNTSRKRDQRSRVDPVLSVFIPRDVDDRGDACFAAIAVGKMQLDRLLESYMAGIDAERIAHRQLVAGL